jgi:steroid delta-isomerase-like uncharacterized protein
MTDASHTAAAFLAAYNGHDADAAAALYAPDGRHVEVAQGQTREGRAAIHAGLGDFLASFPDAHWEPDAVIAADDGVAIPYVLTGSLQAPLGPFAAQGQRVEFRGVHVLRVSDGEIVESCDYWDSGTFGRQMRAAQG